MGGSAPHSSQRPDDSFAFPPSHLWALRNWSPFAPKRHARVRGCTKVPTAVQVEAAAREIRISPVGDSKVGEEAPAGSRDRRQEQAGLPSRRTCRTRP